MKPQIQEYPGHESALDDMLIEQAQHETFFVCAPQMRGGFEKISIAVHGFKRASSNIQQRSSKHATARQLRFRAKHS